MYLLTQFHEELEYDLLPKVDLLDWWRGKLSSRRLWVLIKQLPPESAFMRAANPEAALIGSWRPLEELVATLVDRFTQANFKNPRPIPRPHEQFKQQQQRQRRTAALEAQADRIRSRKEQP